MTDQDFAQHSRPGLLQRGKGLAIAMALAITVGMGLGALTGGNLHPTDVLAQSAIESHAEVASVAAAANPAVVTITTLQELTAPGSGSNGIESLLPGANENGQGGRLVPLGTGTGFIVDEAGHVVTNAHVVSGGSAFEVTYFDGTSAFATLTGADSFQDIAVLKIDLGAGQSVPGTVSFGDSDLLQPGDPVVSIGTPYGRYANTVTSGIINAVERGLDSGGGYSLPNLLQHDAGIFPGNSGGPLLNSDSEVVGINVAKAFNRQMGTTADSGFNFAIESNAASEIVAGIIANGVYDRPYLGIRGHVTWGGVEVVSVEDGGPAAAAGLEAGDVIAGIAGVAGDDPNEALDIVLFEKQPGDVVFLEFVRGGDLITVDVTLGVRPAEMTS